MNDKNLASEIISDFTTTMQEVRKNLVELQGDAIKLAYGLENEIKKLDRVMEGK